jgi:hypothetical protein
MVGYCRLIGRGIEKSVVDVTTIFLALLELNSLLFGRWEWSNNDLE